MRDFNHTVGVLVKAYLNNDLVHGDCSACAVGNIVAEAIGYKYYHVRPMHVSDSGKIKIRGEGWAAVFCTTDKNSQSIVECEYVGDAKKQIDATGYTWQELARIELAFEQHNELYTGINCEDTAMFNGLIAVVDVLAEIHNIDLETTEKAKALFVKH